MIKKLSTAAILATTMLGGTVPFAYGMDPNEIREEGKSTFSAHPLPFPQEEREAPALTSAQKMQAELLELQRKTAAIQEALLREAQEQAQMQTEETLRQKQQLEAIATQKEELAKQEEALKQQREANALQAAFLERQKREAEEERQRVAIEKERSEAAARLAAAQQKTLEEERQKAEAAAAQRREQQAKLEREAQELLNTATKKFEQFTQDINGKLSRHNQRVEQRSANAKYAQYTGGKAVKNHILATTANDDPAQTLIKLAATDDNLYMTLMLKKDACPERTGDIGLENKLKAAKLEYIKQQQLSATTKK